jgi:hypothetical protein
MGASNPHPRRSTGVPDLGSFRAERTTAIAMPTLSSQELYRPRHVIFAVANKRGQSMTQAQYFVLNDNGQWKIKAGYRHTGPYDSKNAAMCAAINYAEKDGQTGRNAQVLVQGEDRTFRVEWTYARDPYPSEAAHPRPATPARAG